MACHVADSIPRRSSPMGTRIVDRFVALGGVVPYALVALFLRLLMAWDFFRSGQAKAIGPTVPLAFRGFNFSLVLPMQVRDEAVHAFDTPFANSPISPAIVANLVVYAEFLLPICLVLGFGTRVSALLLLILTGLSALYHAPDVFWMTHVHWVAILLVLITCGGGALSLDRLIWRLYQQ